MMDWFEIQQHRPPGEGLTQTPQQQIWQQILKTFSKVA